MDPAILAKIEAHNAENLNLKRKLIRPFFTIGLALLGLGSFLIFKPSSWAWFTNPTYLNLFLHKTSLAIVFIGFAFIIASFRFKTTIKGRPRA